MTAVVYLDSSAIVKLVVNESDSQALRSAAHGWKRRTASALSRVEVTRTLRRLGVEPAQGRHALSTVSLLGITNEVLDAASGLGPFGLRSLDAIHLATALSLQSELSAFVSYDERLLAAADEAGLPTLAPR